MSKLLPTQLPISYDGNVDGALYNRLIRILEINLGFDTTVDRLQVYDGDKWLNIDITDASSFSGPPENGLSAQASLGIVSVATKGSISIHL